MSDGQTESHGDHGSDGPARPPARPTDRPADGPTDRRHDRARADDAATEARVLPFPSMGRRRDIGPDAETADPAPQLRDAFGDVLRDERLRQGRTLADVAERAAVSLPYLSEVERGRKEVSSDLLDAIGRSLDLPLPDLLERAADRLRLDGRRLRHQGGSGFQLRAA